MHLIPSNVKITKDIDVISANAVLTGEISGIPSDDKAKPIGVDATLKDLYEGEVLQKVAKLSESSPDTKIGEAFAKLQAKDSK